MKIMAIVLMLLMSSYSYTSTSESSRTDKKFTAMGHFNILSTWIPYKKGLSFGWNASNKWTFEGSYEWANVSFPSVSGMPDLGKISEQRYSLTARKFTGNSFHFIFGLFYQNLEARVGDAILDQMADQSLKVFEVSGAGATFGIGNRWLWDNGLSFQVEWFKINYPLFAKRTQMDLVDNISDANDKKDLKDTMNHLESFPTFSLFGLGLGYSF